MKLKVGDRVRILGGADTGHRVGDQGTVAGINPDWMCPYRVSVDGNSGFYSDGELEVIHVPALLPVVPEGMTPDDLADYVQAFVNAAKDRVLGVGADQYASYGADGRDRQLFEAMTPGQLITMAREEAQDLAVYAAMLDIRLARISEALNNKGVGNAA
ncbi:hypothetical protein GCM10029963_28800 [Micromonospora andamanensis]|uniref:hypothetical protein n=1 Tax=Micromonospora andamanensis TaxID=1287068 RepID=UPI0019504D4F|nr:hypothetical protein [Micromonospora andamanensis]GIJ38487.1 hypothetical protein Vwe01_18120 [Micromonospora andamanensis]